MNIDFEKLIKLMLPIRVRTGLQYIITAVATTIQSLFDDFQLWQIDMRLQAAITCQVMYLELILNYRLLGTFTRTIYITDGDGTTVDFIVNVPSGVTVDANRMIGLLEKYKTFGKRYTIGQSTYTYEMNWGDFVCETVPLTFEAQWSGFVCELIEQVNLIDNHLTITPNGTNLIVELEYTASSDMDIEVSWTVAGYNDPRTNSGTIDIGGVAAYIEAEYLPKTYWISKVTLNKGTENEKSVTMIEDTSYGEISDGTCRYIIE